MSTLCSFRAFPRFEQLPGMMANEIHAVARHRANTASTHGHDKKPQIYRSVPVPDVDGVSSTVQVL